MLTHRLRRTSSQPRRRAHTHLPLMIEPLECRVVPVCNSLSGNIATDLNDAVNGYCLTGDVTIPTGNSVAVASGVEVRSDNPNSEILVDGTLTATGARFTGFQTEIIVNNGGRLNLQGGSAVAGDRVVYQPGSLGAVTDSSFSSARFEFYSDLVTVANSTFTRVDPVVTNPSLVPKIISNDNNPSNDNTFTNPATIDFLGTATTPATWEVIPNVSKYRQVSRVGINTDVTLTIESGVEVRMDSGSFNDVTVNGTLAATGVRFTGTGTFIDVGLGGRLNLQGGTTVDGKRIAYFSGSLGTVTDSVFGTAQLLLFSDGVTVANTTFNRVDPVATSPTLVPKILSNDDNPSNDNTFINPATIHIGGFGPTSQGAATPATWGVVPNMSKYRLDGSVTVFPDVTLTIQPGVEVRTESNSVDILVDGTFTATGVNFTGFDAGAGTLATEIRVRNGGRLNLAASAVAGNIVDFDLGSSGTVSCSTFSSIVEIDSTAAVTALRNDFSSPLTSVRATGNRSLVLDLRNQWWGTIDLASIEGKILHNVDNGSLPLVLFDPPLRSVPTCNNPPAVSASPTSLVVNENGAATITLNGSDPETPAGNLKFTITAAPGNGTVTQGSTVLQSGDTLTGSPVDVIYTPNRDYTGPDSFQFKVTDRGSPEDCTGAPPACAAPLDSGVVSVSITVIPNAAPVLDNTGSMTLAAINEDNVSNNGTLVSAIIASAQPPDRITDLSAGALEGLAVIAADNSNGQWQFSTDNAANWTAFGAPSEARARLLASDSSTRVRFVPNADFNGLVATGLTFRAWDQTSGSNGATTDVSTNGGTTAFSTATDTASIRVTAQPDAPVAADDAYAIEQDIALVVGSPGVLTNDIDVDGDSITAILVNGPTGGRVTLNTDGTFSYTANTGFAGVDSFTYRASDGTLDSSEATVSITVIALASCTPLLVSPSLVAGPLVCLGTRRADQIHITLKGEDTIEVSIVKPFKSRATFPLASVSRIVVRTLEGNDSVQIASNVTVPAWLFGGPGNDVLQAARGSENNVLVGDDGNDTLEAGTDRLKVGEGRDLLIGGRGKDHLKASAGDNLLVAGFTEFDRDMTALQAIMNEWTRADQTYQQRVDHLLLGGGLNGAIRLNSTTVHDDGDVDVLDGAPSTIWLDWFFANLDGDGDKKKKDKVNGLTGARIATDINVL